MGKYERIQSDVFSVFNQNTWKAEAIKTYPVNYISVTQDTEFIRVSVIPSGQGINLISSSGLVLIDIFISAGNGPRRASLIADKLDQYLVGKSLVTENNANTQFGQSSLVTRGLDRDNPTLYASTYSIPFNYFGVL
jgi:hypothetical protein